MTSKDIPISKQNLQGKFLHFLNRAYIENQVTILALFSVPPTPTLKLLKSPVRRNFNRSLIDGFPVFLLMRQEPLTGAWKPRWFTAGNPLPLRHITHTVARGCFAFKVINLIR